ncbi:MAG: type II toxin-antitoxin system VapC family toxin [Candidatus Bathyarchaeota archaeon]|nr:type II toxin-antitoxin system VapC family toxin [Candidatus Bathyarchaeota archaeon]
MGTKTPVIGLDANILIYALDPAFPEHGKLDGLLFDLSPEKTVAVNPTVIHETYHTLVHFQNIVPSDAVKRLNLIMKHPYIEFYNQTKRICQIGLKLAEKYALGGRDSLILSNYLANKIPVMYTHDRAILKLKKVSWREGVIALRDPVEGIE